MDWPHWSSPMPCAKETWSRFVGHLLEGRAKKKKIAENVVPPGLKDQEDQREKIVVFASKGKPRVLSTSTSLVPLN